MSGIIEIIITKVVIPYIADFMRKNPGATDADAIAAYQSTKARLKMKTDLSRLELDADTSSPPSAPVDPATYPVDPVN